MRAKKALREVKRCVSCGAPERISHELGVPITNLTPYSRLCVECVNKGIKRR